jgi:hypothetical protein
MDESTRGESPEYFSMTIHLPQGLESAIVGAVRSGRYASLDDAMADAASLFVWHLENERTRGKSVARLAFAISLGTLVWASVIAFAVFGFSQQNTYQSPKNRLEEIVYFGYAFSVAGAITGAVAYVAAGKKRWAIGVFATEVVLLAAEVVLLAASVPIVPWLIYRSIASTGRWNYLISDSMRDSAAFGAVLGVCSALVVSVLVLASIVLERHTKRWQFGLIVAVAIACLGLWLLPVIAFGLPELVAPYVGFKYAQIHDTSLFAAGMTGAGAGSLAGAVVAGLLGRWFKSESPGFRLSRAGGRHEVVGR